MLKTMIGLMVLLATSVMVLPGFAATPCSNKTGEKPTAMLMVHPSVGAIAKAQPESAKHVVQSYINTQLALHGLTPQQFQALEPDVQRAVLAPGRQYTFSRESRRAIVPMRRAVPDSIMKSIQINGVLAADVKQKYAVPMPVDVLSTLQMAPGSHQVVLIGNKLVMVDANDTILSVVPDLF